MSDDPRGTQGAGSGGGPGRGHHGRPPPHGPCRQDRGLSPRPGRGAGEGGRGQGGPDWGPGSTRGRQLRGAGEGSRWGGLVEWQAGLSWASNGPTKGETAQAVTTAGVLREAQTPLCPWNPTRAGRGGASVHSGSDQPVPPCSLGAPHLPHPLRPAVWSLARLGLLAPIHLDTVPSPGSQLTCRTTPSIPHPSRGRLGNKKEGGFRPQEAEAPG